MKEDEINSTKINQEKNLKEQYDKLLNKKLKKYPITNYFIKLFKFKNSPKNKDYFIHEYSKNTKTIHLKNEKQDKLDILIDFLILFGLIFIFILTSLSLNYSFKDKQLNNKILENKNKIEILNDINKIKLKGIINENR
jgi:hypothetical protein